MQRLHIVLRARGYQVAMLARNLERLQLFEQEIPGSKAYKCDVSDLDSLLNTADTVRKDLEKIRVNTTPLLYLARELAPVMIEAGQGTVIVTGNTAAAHRGLPFTPLFAPTKAAQRILSESLARDLGPKGIHVAYITIDAAIDAPWTREDFFSNKPDEFFSKPVAIAEEVFHIAH